MKDIKMLLELLLDMVGHNRYDKPVRLRLSAKSVSQPAVFFSQKKTASSTFSQPD
jgi:hypothetical protein